VSATDKRIEVLRKRVEDADKQYEKSYAQMRRDGKVIRKAREDLAKALKSRQAARRKAVRDKFKDHVGCEVVCNQRVKPTWIAGRVGRLVEVLRTYAYVDYGEKGEWKIPLANLEPVKQEAAAAD